MLLLLSLQCRSGHHCTPNHLKTEIGTMTINCHPNLVPRTMCKRLGIWLPITLHVTGQQPEVKLVSSASKCVSSYVSLWHHRVISFTFARWPCNLTSQLHFVTVFEKHVSYFTGWQILYCLQSMDIREAVKNHMWLSTMCDYKQRLNTEAIKRTDSCTKSTQ